MKWVDDDLKILYDVFAGESPRPRGYPGTGRLFRVAYTSIIDKYMDVILRKITPQKDNRTSNNKMGKQEQNETEKKKY